MAEGSFFPDAIDEGARRRFERAWSAGSPVSIESVLPAADAVTYPGTVEELVAIELELAWRAGAGERPLIEGYHARFPSLRDSTITLRLLREEYRVRQLFGDRPSVQEYCRRFPHVVSTGRELGEPVAPPESCGLPEIPNYEITGVIGRGGMGIVFAARDIRLNRRVALKMLRAGREASPTELARFRAEAEAVARLQHANIVGIYEVAEHEGRSFLALEFVDGGNLAEQLEASPPTIAKTAELIETLARAVQCAHDHGIVHRDLKPSNVLLTRDGVPKISDFGVAKLLAPMPGQDSEQTRTGEMIGTPAYMAPEQTNDRGATIGPATDVYALGAIFYRALTGRPPFCGETAWDTIAQLKADDPLPPSRLRPRLSRDLDTICLHCLEKDPARRYASCAELADDLARARGGLPIRARPITALGRGVKWMRRKPVTATLIAVTLLATLALLVGGLWYNRQLGDALNRETALRKGAEANLRAACAAVDQMLTRVAAARLAKLPHTERVVAQLLEDALGFYQEFLDRHGDHAEVRRESARAYRRLGDIRLQLGRIADAERDYLASLDALDRLLKADPRDVEVHLDLAGTLNNYANLLLATQREAEAEVALRAGIDACADLLRIDAVDERVTFRLGELRHSLGSLLSDSARIVEAETLLRAALDGLAQLVDRAPSVAGRDQLARTCHNLGLLLRNSGRRAEAIAPLRRAAALQEELARLAPDEPRARSDLGGTLNTLGILSSDLGDTAAAQVAYARALVLRQQLVSDFPAFSDYHSALAATLHNLGELDLEAGELSRAAQRFEQAIQYQRTAHRASPQDPTCLRQLFNHYWATSETLARLGRHTGAVSAAKELVALTPGSTEGCRLAAALLCRCIAVVGDDAGLDEPARGAYAKGYGDDAMAFLRTAVERGLKDKSVFDAADFDPLRPRPEFQALLTSLR